MAKPVVKKIIEVGERQYMPLPDNNKLVVGGPAEVENIRYDNGQLQVRIVKGQPSPVELAVAQKWERLSWQV
jgi:hypothetical protein